MNPAKIRLSATELELVTNTDWILTKNGIIQKVKNMLEALQAEQQEYLAKEKINFPAEFTSSLPKISKGENYKGLPYLVLDHPRYFNKENVFTIRTMFWCGKFFSALPFISPVVARIYFSNDLAIHTRCLPKMIFFFASIMINGSIILKRITIYR